MIRGVQETFKKLGSDFKFNIIHIKMKASGGGPAPLRRKTKKQVEAKPISKRIDYFSNAAKRLLKEDTVLAANLGACSIKVSLP